MPEDAEHYEAVVVGCGPAGAATALQLADLGVETLVLERGDFAGQKNVTGGILYAQRGTRLNLDDLLPDLLEEAPLERPIDAYQMHTVSGDKVHTLDISPLHHHKTKWSRAVLRAKMDPWIADRVHEATREHGGGLLTGVHVEGPIVKDGRIVGVACEELEPIHADVVVAADGATSEMVRKAGLRGWMTPERWFQGVKVVTEMPSDAIEARFGLDEGRGSAHLFAGNLFDGVRGGGFLYTNDDTLSIGTVFHLDSIAEEGIEPAYLLDRLLTHPLMASFLGPHTDELEYSAKLIPDGKKCAMAEPYRDTLLAVGDAAGQMQAAGPVIKGMNLGISAGMLAARAVADARDAGDVGQAGPRYAAYLQDSYVWRSLTYGQRGVRAAVRNSRAANGLLRALVTSGLGRFFIRTKPGRAQLQKMFSSYAMAAKAPDNELVYATVPEVIADELGEPVGHVHDVEPRTLEDRIADLDYDTAIGNPHIEVLDDSERASGACVYTCPVSARDFSKGCYRYEKVETDRGTERVVALDVQPCIECGTCAVMGDVAWKHPPGGKGVEWEYG